jgi:hypothetical protein
MYPGANVSAVRRWTAPLSGLVKISGMVKDRSTASGDGVTCLIKKNGVTIWSQKVQNGDNIGYAFNVRTEVTVDDTIDFIVKDDNSNVEDRTYFDPTITYLDPLPDIPVGNG